MNFTLKHWIIVSIILLPLSAWGNYNVYPYNLVPTLDGRPHSSYLPGALVYLMAAAVATWVWEDYLMPILKYKRVSVQSVVISLGITCVLFVFLKGAVSGFYYLWA